MGMGVGMRGEEVGMNGDEWGGGRGCEGLAKVTMKTKDLTEKTCKKAPYLPQIYADLRKQQLGKLPKTGEVNNLDLALSGLLKNDDGNAMIIASQIRVLFPFREALEQVPCGLVGDAPVFSGDKSADGPVAGGLAQLFLQFCAQRSAHAAGAVAMDQLHRLASGLARHLEFVLHAQPGPLHGGHAFFQVDDFDERGFAGHRSKTLPLMTA